MEKVKPIFCCDTKYPTPTPDASQWNIGGIGSPMQNFRVGHVHFVLFMSISFASGTQRKLVFQWNMGLKHFHICNPMRRKGAPCRIWRKCAVVEQKKNGISGFFKKECSFCPISIIVNRKVGLPKKGMGVVRVLYLRACGQAIFFPVLYRQLLPEIPSYID